MSVRDRLCPSCGMPVPTEVGQHAENLVSSQVRCPHCGAKVLLDPDAQADETAGDVPRAQAAPPGRHEDSNEAFSGQETLDDLADELRDKPT